MKTNGGALAKEEILELYDGQLAIKSTRRLISDAIPTLRVTARGRELYALGESFYCRWLSEGGNIALVERAIDLCRQAVALGYPSAVVKMAFYYDKDYVALDRTEEFRCRVACDYYGKVAYCDYVPRIDDGVTPEISWEKLQAQAARMMLEMLSAAKRSHTGSYGEKYEKAGKYSFDENYYLLKERYGVSVDTSAIPQRIEREREKFTAAVFDACKHNKLRAPLFGVTALNCAEAKTVFAPKSKVMRICQDVNIWLYNGEKVTRVNATTAFYNFISSLSGDGVWIYFVNHSMGGHKYLNGKQRKDLCELMMKDNFSRFSRLKNSAEERGRSEYLFSDDDVQFCLSGRFKTLKSALDGLIDRVESEKEWSEL